tara:strand:- start:169 stop:801 length:633 start_codon:yes stop_codon:yes gene_type:complete
MDYLDRFDNYKRTHCVELSTKDKLRTGYSNKNQLQQGLKLFKSNRTVSVDDAKLMTILYPDVRDKIRMGQKISSGDDQLLAIYDDGIADNTLSERGYGFLSESGSERSYDSPPASAVAIEDRVGQQIQQLFAQYEMGRLSQAELGEAILQQEERFATMEEAPTGETRVSGMGLDTREPTAVREPAPPVRTIADLPRDEEGGTVPTLPSRM